MKANEGSISRIVWGVSGAARVTIAGTFWMVVLLTRLWSVPAYA